MDAVHHIVVELRSWAGSKPLAVRKRHSLGYSAACRARASTQHRENWAECARRVRGSIPRLGLACISVRCSALLPVKKPCESAERSLSMRCL